MKDAFSLILTVKEHFERYLLAKCFCKVFRLSFVDSLHDSTYRDIRSFGALNILIVMMYL